MRHCSHYHRIVSAFCLAFVLLMLVSCGGKSQRDKALIQACKLGNLEEVEILIFDGANVDARDGRGNSALKWACTGKHLEVVKYLLDHGADFNAPNRDGETPLMAASYVGVPDLTVLLINYGADIEKRKQTLPVIYALNHAQDNDLNLLKNAYSTKNTSPSDQIKAILFHSGAIHYSMIKLEMHNNQAYDHLKKAII